MGRRKRYTAEEKVKILREVLEDGKQISQVAEEYIMKKLLLAFGIVCLFISCETKYYSVLVKNNSETKTVSYTYNGSPSILAPGESKNYEVEAYTLPPAEIEDENGIASIEMKRDGDTFTFEDAEPIIFNVLNTCPFAVKIKADNYIWYEYCRAHAELAVLEQSI